MAGEDIDIDMIAEILATGDEIRSGALVDSNSAYISQKLEENGVEVTRHNCTGDDLNVLSTIIKEIANRSHIAVVTGGLGPTTDDMSAQAAADAAGVELVLDAKALENVESFFKKFNRPMSESNRKQALLPKDAKCLYNTVGTASGFSLKIDGCVFFFLPGVPYEMKKMMEINVIPEIARINGGSAIHSRVANIPTFGLGESVVGEKVMAVESLFPGIKLGLRANFPQVQVKLYARDNDETRLEALLENGTKWVSDQLKQRVISTNGESMEKRIGSLLVAKNQSIAVAESCTGGLIANWLTNTAGSSDYFLLSAVTYSNEAKIKVLGVPEQIIETNGAVHEKTAKEMAIGVKRISGATWGLSTSGIAGPSGGTKDKPVGTVCIGLAGPDTAFAKRLYYPFGRRLMNKKIFAMAALDILRRELMGADNG